MTDQLRPDTCNEIRILCKKISVAHDLDEEIQEELYGHMEDKLTAYLDGEEALSEEDAFILVREHFGNPSTVKGLLQDVHAREADVSLARRLGAVLIVTAGVNAICLCLASAVLPLWPAARGFGGFHASLSVVSAVTVVFSWLLLRHWRRRLDAGHTPWFLTWPPAYFVGSAVVLSVLQSLVQITSLFDNSVSVMWSIGVWRLLSVILLASPVLKCMMWLWWCDRPPRKARAVSTAAGLWVVWMWLSSSVANTGIAMRSVSLPQIAIALGASFLYSVVFALIASALYGTARYAATHYARRSAARTMSF